MIEIINFLKDFDLHQILSTIAIIWVFTNFKFKKLNKEIETIKNNVERIDRRLIRLEGRFEERGQWESRDRKIGE